MTTAHLARSVLLVVLICITSAPGSARVTLARDTPKVVINQIFGGGSSGPGVPPRDFVELVNLGAEPVAFSGWSVQYAAAGSDTWKAIPLQGVVPAGEHYLVRLGETNQPTAPMLAPNASGTQNMGASDGKVALVRGWESLTCAGLACPDDPLVVDFVGYGSANAFEGMPAPAGSSTLAIQRADGAADSDDNGADFTPVAPNPRNTSATGEACVRTAPLIREIQGSSHRSHLEGCRVTDVAGIVTAVHPAGFFLQDASDDGDDATAEGLFVAVEPRDRLTPVAVGDLAQVDGVVVEARMGAGLTRTGIDAAAIDITDENVALPAVVTIGVGQRQPPPVMWDASRGENVEATTVFDPAAVALDFYESLEGMRVEVEEPLVVGPQSVFGELPVVASNGAGVSPRTARGGVLLAEGDVNPERIVLDDDLLSGMTWPLLPDTSVGDRLGPPCCEGVVDYGVPGTYRVLLTQAPTLIPGGLTPEATTPAGEDELAVATFNVENLDANDDPAKFARLAEIIVDDLGAPDLIAVEEMQDRNGPVNDVIVDATPTYGLLIAAILDAGGPCYRFAQIDPLDNEDGGEGGGNIRQGFLYREDRGLRLMDGTPGDALTAVEVSLGPTLSVNPGRIDPENPAWKDPPGSEMGSRKPLVAAFRFNGHPIFVIANHFSSKGGDEPLFGRRQPPFAETEERRIAQAAAVREYVDDLLLADPQANVIVLGDLNDFAYSETLAILTGADSPEGALTNLITTLPADEQYTYVFEGNAQVLDHVLLSANLVPAVTAFDVVRVNAEFGDGVSDHDPQVVHLALAADGTPGPSNATPVTGICM